MNTRCLPKHVPSAACFFTLCRLTVQPPQSYSVGGQRSSGQLTGKPADARSDHRGRWCAMCTLNDVQLALKSSTNYAELTLCQQQQEYHSQTNVSDMWVEFFKRGKALNLLQVVQHVLAISPSNVFVDSIFSIMKNLWTNERHRLQVDMVKAKLFVHCNYKMTCSEFAGFLKTGAAKEHVAATREEQYN
ncbi:UNVERIFIED_CONTAM: hypothetical protein FKN15_009234 [Acipenser sinensis]